ncbi:hypothetical protein ABT095_19935 [Kitasatospora sp. NPDC002227]|uniref:hypothetical protein n=1 Tax=Kitasatospora sp. NPDC002227 TaxID=3154773 RepID=UPI00331EB0CF
MREIAMAMLNPTHSSILTQRINLGDEPAGVTTLFGHTYRMKGLAIWASRNNLPDDLSQWHLADARRFIEEKREAVDPTSLGANISVVRLLYRLSRVLTGGGLVGDPWPGMTSREIAGTVGGVAARTKNISPEVWFALVKSAWTYIHEFSPDIFAARDSLRRLTDGGIRGYTGSRRRLRLYLDDPDSLIPLHTDDRNAPGGTLNQSMLLLLSGTVVDSSYEKALGGSMDKIYSMINEGRTMSGGLLREPRQVVRQDGSVGPWHPGFSKRSLSMELTQLRAACYIFVSALSMMRDSEVREITRGSVVEYYGSPAVVSKKRKLDPAIPTEHWWIIEPVAEAISVAEKLSLHDDLIFSARPFHRTSALEEGVGEYFNSGLAIGRFIEQVNRLTAWHGLHIPSGKAAPHQFRKTMSMLVGTHDGAEIALGIQLKHVATRALSNRVTQGYMSTDAEWSRMLDSAIEDAHFDRLKDFYDDYKAGRPIGFGPGAEKIMAEFAMLEKHAETLRSTGRARNGDARVEYDLLRKARVPLRFGKLNHCTFDERDPTGAVCIENASIGTITEPRPDMCRPDRCANSIISPAHIPIWSAEQASLTRQIASPKVATPRRQVLLRELEAVNNVIKKAEQ